MLLLLLGFFLSAVGWLEEFNLFSSFSSLLVCWATSGSSSLGSGLGVSGSGVWKLQSAELVTLWKDVQRNFKGAYINPLGVIENTRYYKSVLD